ncbi:hypothetical protein ACMGE6_11980 [Macrococcus equi]|uniref:hypothetical protein n=1 Tax=Macrococcus equi TaxID=3395462 RepID=UPI0039BE4ADF
MNNEFKLQNYWFMLFYLIPFAFFDAWAEIVQGSLVVYLPMFIFAVIMNTIFIKKNLSFVFILISIIVSYLISLGISYIAPVTVDARHDIYALMPLGVNLFLLFSTVVFTIFHSITYVVMKVIYKTRNKGLYTK